MLCSSRRLSFLGVAMLVAALSGRHTVLIEAAAAQATLGERSSELNQVPSKDGTLIGVECSGSGPTLLFVHGGVGDRTRWTAMVPLLSADFTVCAMDRRGRGASGDSAEYSLMKEAQDVAAVVDSRAGQVYVFGHSYGGVVALEATFLTSRIAKLMLYEPPVLDPVDENLAVAERIEKMIAAGQLEQALVTFQAEVVRQSPEELAAMRTRASWPSLVVSMSSLPRQLRALAGYRFDANRMKSVTMPTLLLLGEDTPSPYAQQSIGALHESLPDARLVVLENQEHNAMEGGRDLLANSIIEFAMERSPR
jgi:pimeloyl-ACP methyl ester carboxylesterase